MNTRIWQLLSVLCTSAGALAVTLLLLNGRVLAANQCVAPGGIGGCFGSIQAAVNAALPNDIVQVVAGTYTETIVISKSLTLEGGYDDTTLTSRTPRSSIVDGGNGDSVLKIENGTNVTLDGFTIQNGNGTAAGGSGGGVRIENAAATVRDNLIQNNVGRDDAAGTGYGGGVYIVTGTVTIEDNTIQNNAALSVTLVSTTTGLIGSGGGVWVDRGSTAVITGNQIMSNTAALTSIPTQAIGAGGGVGSSGAGTSVTVSQNSVHHNLGSLDFNALGGGIFLRLVDAADVWGNAVLENTGVISGFGFGGGIYLSRIPTVTVRDNSINANLAAEDGSNPGGGGLQAFRIVSLTLRGNQIMSNTAARRVAGGDVRADGGGLSILGFGLDDDAALIEDNVIKGNTAVHTMSATTMGHAEGGGIYVTQISTTQIISNDIDDNVAVRTLSITGSGGWGGRPSGGGLYVNNSDIVTFTNNRVQGNVTAVSQTVDGVSSAADGGGMSLETVLNAAIDNNQFLNNTALVEGTFTNIGSETFYATGGGVRVGCVVGTSCQAMLTQNDFDDNAGVDRITTSSNAGGGGGGVNVYNTTTTLSANEFVGNTGNVNDTNFNSFGGAVSTNDATLVSERNRFLDNGFSTTSGVGSHVLQIDNTSFTSANDLFAGNYNGIGAFNDNVGTIVNGTFYQNGAAAVHSGLNSNMTVNNTIVADHVEGLRNDGTSTLTSDYNLLDNTANFGGSVTAGANDIIDQDPLFQDAAAGDFHLQSGSPAIDAGDNAVAPAVDFEGDTRPFDGDFDGTPTVDIGVDEIGNALYLPLIVKS